MIKSMFGALALFIFLMVVPVSGQVDIDAGLTPSEAMTEAEQAFYAKVSVWSEIMLSECVNEFLGPVEFGTLAWVCVFETDEGMYDLMAFTTDATFQNLILVLHDGEFLGLNFGINAEDQVMLHELGLQPGEYEVLFSGLAGSVAARMSFWFWIEDSEEG